MLYRSVNFLMAGEEASLLCWVLYAGNIDEDYYWHFIRTQGKQYIVLHTIAFVSEILPEGWKYICSHILKVIKFLLTLREVALQKIFNKST